MRKTNTMKPNSNSKAGLTYLISSIFNKGIVFLTIPIFTRILTTSDYGIVNTYLSWVTMISIIIGLSMGNSIRSASKDFEKDIKSYLYSIITLSFINFIILISLIITSHIFFEIKVDLTLSILVLIQSLSTFIINVFLVYYMMEKKFIKRALLISLPTLLITISSIILIILIDNKLYLGRIIPYVIIQLGFSIILYLNLIKNKNVKFSTKYWRYALKISLPLIFHGLSITILSVSDRTLISLFISNSATGIYSLVYSLSIVSIAINSAFESVWIPWFHEKMNLDLRRHVNKAAEFYLDLMTFIVVLTILIGPEIIKIFSPVDYWSGIYIISPIMIGTFFILLYSLLVDLEYYFKSTKAIAINTFFAAVLNIFLNIIFIPLYGYQAAAYTTLFSYIITFLLHYLNSRKLDSNLFNLRIFLFPIFVVSFIGILSNIFISYFWFRWITFSLFAIIYCIKIFSEKKYKLIFYN